MELPYLLVVCVVYTYCIAIIVGSAQASTLICFEIDGKAANYSFQSEEVSFKKARHTLNLTPNQLFKDEGRVLSVSNERRILVNVEVCNKVFSKNQNARITIQISDDKPILTITLQNDAKLDTVRAEVMKSLPEHYKNEKCADLYFINKAGFEVPRIDEAQTQFQNILSANSKITLKNRFLQNRTDVEIEWLLESWLVQVNMDASLSDLRYWITKPLDCPNLKIPLKLPDKPLFNTKNNKKRTNWLARDKKAELENILGFQKVTSYLTALTAPLNQEEVLPIERYVYNTKSLNKKIYYVDVLEERQIFFAGSKTKEFTGANFKINVISRDSEDKILLLLNNVRSTNSRALTWDNVVIATNNTRAAIVVEFLNHRDTYLYDCKLFDHGAENKVHYLMDYLTYGSKCTFDHIGSLTDASELIFNKETVIESGEDLTTYRYEISVTMTPYPEDQHRCSTYRRRRRRSNGKGGNIDLNEKQITMGNIGKGKHKGDISKRVGCTVRNNEFTENNKITFHLNVFIFKSHEIAEKIIGNIPII